MRSLHAIVIMLMILSAFCIVPAAAANSDANVNFEILGPELLIDISRASPVQESVMQGETKYHTYYTSGSDTTLEISLTWDRSTGNDLDLIIVPPNASATTIHDSNDGRTDGKIVVRTALQQGADSRWTVRSERCCSIRNSAVHSYHTTVMYDG